MNETTFAERAAEHSSQTSMRLARSRLKSPNHPRGDKGNESQRSQSDEESATSCPRQS
jgi:hypothetical protein